MRHRWKLGRVLNMSASYGLGFGNGGFHYWLIWLVVWKFWNMFYFSILIGNNNPNCLIVFRGVDTTNEIIIVFFLLG